MRRSAGYFGPSPPKMPVRYATQSAQLSEIRAARPEMAGWSFSSQQATLRRLDKAFKAFFRRVASLRSPVTPASRRNTASTVWSGRPTVTVVAGSPR